MVCCFLLLYDFWSFFLVLFLVSSRLSRRQCQWESVLSLPQQLLSLMALFSLVSWLAHWRKRWWGVAVSKWSHTTGGWTLKLEYSVKGPKKQTGVVLPAVTWFDMGNMKHSVMRQAAELPSHIRIGIVLSSLSWEGDCYMRVIKITGYSRRKSASNLEELPGVEALLPGSFSGRT